MNVILDPIFIFCFEWGMMGAAVATVLGQVLTAALSAIYLCRAKLLRPAKADFLPAPRIAGRCMVLGASSFLAQISLVAAMAAINNMVQKYSAPDPVLSAVVLIRTYRQLRAAKKQEGLSR